MKQAECFKEVVPFKANLFKEDDEKGAAAFWFFAHLGHNWPVWPQKSRLPRRYVNVGAHDGQLGSLWSPVHLRYSFGGQTSGTLPHSLKEET